MSRPRPLASSRSVTALRSKASAPTPYTVSVGSTISWPIRIAATAWLMPSSRCAGSVQSNRRLMPAYPSRLAPLPRPGHAPTPRRLSAADRGDEPVPAGQVLVVAGLLPARPLGDAPVHRAALG